MGSTEMFTGSGGHQTALDVQYKFLGIARMRTDEVRNGPSLSSKSEAKPVIEWPDSMAFPIQVGSLKLSRPVSATRGRYWFSNLRHSSTLNSGALGPGRSEKELNTHTQFTYRQIQILV